jgi:hypothetical protein
LPRSDIERTRRRSIDRCDFVIRGVLRYENAWHARSAFVNRRNQDQRCRPEQSRNHVEAKNVLLVGIA